MVASFGKAHGANTIDDLPSGIIDPERYFPQLSRDTLDQPQNHQLKISLTIVGMNDLFAKYAWRVIVHEPKRFAQFVLFNLQPLKAIIPWALLLIVTSWNRTLRSSHVGTVTGLFLLLHLFHTTPVAIITLLVPRYSNLTLLPFCFLSMVFVSESVLQAVRRRRHTFF